MSAHRVVDFAEGRQSRPQFEFEKFKILIKARKKIDCSCNLITRDFVALVLQEDFC